MALKAASGRIRRSMGNPQQGICEALGRGFVPGVGGECARGLEPLGRLGSKLANANTGALCGSEDARDFNRTTYVVMEINH